MTSRVICLSGVIFSGSLVASHGFPRYWLAWFSASLASQVSFLILGSSVALRGFLHHWLPVASRAIVLSGVAFPWIPRGLILGDLRTTRSRNFSDMLIAGLF